MDSTAKHSKKARRAEKPCRGSNIAGKPKRRPGQTKPAAEVFCGDNRLLLANMAENSVDACVTDPPYGLDFLNKEWDGTVPETDCWRAVHRVLKPGAYIAAFSAARTYHKTALAIEAAGFEIRTCLMWLYGTGFRRGCWLADGSHTGLKPAHEPIVLARKLPEGENLNANVAKWGAGGLHIERCKVGSRGPANVMHDGSDEVTSRLEHAAPFFYCAKVSKAEREHGLEDFPLRQYNHDGRKAAANNPHQRHASVSRNPHPTVKPVRLMEWLCRLVTPEGGTILDPFAGSGSTGVAAVREGFGFVGLEINPEYVGVTRAKIEAAPSLVMDG